LKSSAEEVLKSQKTWADLLSINSNEEKLLKYKLISKRKLEDLKNELVGEYYINDWEYEVEVNKNVSVHPSKIVGTYHTGYQNKSLYDVLKSLKRADKNIYKYLENPNYYNDTSKREETNTTISLAYKKHEDKFYICEGANHRFFLSKILNIEDLVVDTVFVYDEDKDLKELFGNIKTLGFDYNIEGDFVNITSDKMFITLYGGISIQENLEAFILNYRELKTSKYSEFKYKLLDSLLSEYRYKYNYSNNEIKNIFHFNFLSLLEHKRSSQC
jgi:hypothetical protein